MMLSACFILAAKRGSNGGTGAQWNVHMLQMKVMKFERTDPWLVIER